MIDCSAGGFLSSRLDLGPGYLVPNAAAVRRKAGIATQAVGFIPRPRRPRRCCATARPISWRSRAKRCSTRTGRAAPRSRSTAMPAGRSGPRNMRGGWSGGRR